MLNIRAEQMKVLAASAALTFERELTELCRDGAPHGEELSEEDLARLARLGIERAEAHGFCTRRQICLYSQVMLLLGCSFDSDVQYPWAARTLADVVPGGEGHAVERLHDQAMTFLDKTAGENNEHLRRALIRMRDFVIALGHSFIPNLAEEVLLSALRRVYPEKVGEQGDEPTRALIRTAAEAARRYGIEDAEGVTIYTGAAFLLGSGFDADPQYPWAAAALSAPDASQRALNLRHAASLALERALSR